MKSKFISFICFFFISILSVQSYAYSVFTLKKVNWGQVKTVDVFIAGFGKELGLQFLYGAITRARMHDELYPDSRAQVVIWAEENGKREDRATLLQRGMHILEVNHWHLRDRSIAKEIRKLPPVSSLHVVSHSSAVYGFALQHNYRTNSDAKLWQQIKDRFTDDFYIFLHGCNTGFLLAPALSKVVKRPVFGSLTSTDFQQIFENDQWYHNNPGTGEFPTGLAKKQVNDVLFSTNESCWKGFCHRMMSNEHNYHGYWGNYTVGLPFYKPFCNFAYSDPGRCMKGIAQAVYTTTAIGAQSWEDKVEDFLCPRMADPKVHSRCVAALKNGGEQNFYRGNTLQCSLKGCDFSLTHTRKGGNKVTNFVGDDAGVKPFEQEYQLLMNSEKFL